MTDAPVSGFFGEYRFLSNFWVQPFKVHGTPLQSVEHGYQALKATNEADFIRVINARSPGVAKRIGSEIQLRSDWDNIKLSVMATLVEEKFKQNPDIAELLLKTGNRELIETNHWGDRFWGKDLSGNGKNNLGKILMGVRNGLLLGPLCGLIC